MKLPFSLHPFIYSYHMRLSIVLCCIAISYLFPFTPAIADDTSQNRDTYQQLETFANVLTLLQQHYVDEIDTEDVITGAITGMLSSLDPHSAYMSPEDFAELQEETKGSFDGIGLEITIRDEVLTVVAPIEGTPAAKQGIQSGDQILKINGEITKNLSLIEAVQRLRGAKGTSVTLSIFRKSWQNMRDITLKRDIIPVQSVRSFELEPGIFYIRISNFQATTTRDFRKQLASEKKDHPIKGLVLDLRNNPGGLLDQAVKISDIFIEEGLIVSTKGRNGQEQMVFNAHKGGSDTDYPMVVLVNGGSASGAEIVAGALQDHKRAIILGTSTFGKGSVQTILPIPGGAGIRLTTARYYTPSGDSIQATGIKPDLIVPLNEVQPEQQKGQAQHQLKERDLPGHFTNDGTTEVHEADQKPSVAPASEEDENGAVSQRLATDNQLRTALFILKSLEIAGKQ
ncbi:S41 family peptidase [Desulfogranum japonicum]|uniref:S41 family peptidase n=1 Tax=Desulfogranum japonicum TaxID=231447 RepID=UPI001E62E85E|nr:S41 family peptidase [Desulfogranum japonicum]